jgi:hypothetical protein
MNFKNEVNLDIPAQRRDVPWIDKCSNLKLGTYQVVTIVFIAGSNNWLLETRYFKMMIKAVQQQEIWNAIDMALFDQNPVFIKVGQDGGGVLVGDEKSPWLVRITERAEIFESGIRHEDTLEGGGGVPTNQNNTIVRRSSQLINPPY